MELKSIDRQSISVGLWALLFLSAAAVLAFLPEVRKTTLEFFDYLINSEQAARFITPIVLGISASVLANWLSVRAQQREWKEFGDEHGKRIASICGDIDKLTLEIATARDDLREAMDTVKAEVNEVRRNYFDLVTAARKAIGGPFTASVLGYHPHSSGTIAKILSDETRKAYDKHWARVVVTDAEDRYLVTSLKRKALTLGQDTTEVLVWEFEYQVKWTWRNDSRVSRRPLDDFYILIVAPEEAVRDFDSRNPESASRMYAEFFAGALNYVKCVVPNPIDREKRLPTDILDQLFDIKSIRFSHGSHVVELDKGDLTNDSGPLPIGVYKRLGIPANRVHEFALNIGETMEVLYEGTMSTPATIGNEGIVYGYLGYVPSDIVANSFSLSLSYPTGLNLDGKKYRLEVSSADSGCQYLRDPLRCNPDLLTVAPMLPEKLRPIPYKQEVAQIKVNESLTHFHLLTMNWKATPVDLQTEE